MMTRSHGLAGGEHVARVRISANRRVEYLLVDAEVFDQLSCCFSVVFLLRVQLQVLVVKDECFFGLQAVDRHVFERRARAIIPFDS